MGILSGTQYHGYNIFFHLLVLLVTEGKPAEALRATLCTIVPDSLMLDRELTSQGLIGKRILSESLLIKMTLNCRIQVI